MWTNDITTSEQIKNYSSDCWRSVIHPFPRCCPKSRNNLRLIQTNSKKLSEKHPETYWKKLIRTELLANGKDFYSEPFMPPRIQPEMSHSLMRIKSSETKPQNRWPSPVQTLEHLDGHKCFPSKKRMRIWNCCSNKNLQAIPSGQAPKCPEIYD